MLKKVNFFSNFILIKICHCTLAVPNVFSVLLAKIKQAENAFLFKIKELL